jgi:uridine phosphorylase
MPNTDLMVREARHSIDGPMAMIRYGTCGVIEDTVPVGDIIVPKTTLLVQQNYDFDPVIDKDPSKAFFISKPCPADPKLHSLLASNFEATFGKTHIHSNGLDATCDTFYTCQGWFHFSIIIGRKQTNFKDVAIEIDSVKRLYPEHQVFEMETYCMQHIFQ